MKARCGVCEKWFRPNRSRRLCDAHYWRVRRLQDKTPDEIEIKLRELAITKACIDAALHASDDDDPAVAPALQQRDVAPAQLQRDGQ